MTINVDGVTLKVDKNNSMAGVGGIPPQIKLMLSNGCANTTIEVQAGQGQVGQGQAGQGQG